MANLSKDQVRAIIAKAPAGTSPEGVVAALREQGHTLEGYSAPETPPSPQEIGVSTGRQMQRQVTGRIAQALPWAGGLAGGMVGGIPGATIGGMLGKVGGQAMTGTLPQTAKQAVDEIGGAGVTQGALTAAGSALGSVAGRLGGTLTGRTLARASAEAENLARASKLKIDRGALLSGIRQLETEAHLMGSRELKALQKLKESFMSGPGELSAKALHDLRQSADDVARRIFEKRAGETPIGPSLAMKGRFWEGIGNQARAILKEGVPGYRNVMRRVQGAIKTREAAQQGARTVAGGALGAAAGSLMGPAGAAIGATGGAGLGATLGRAVINPALLRGLGRGLESPVLASGLARAPAGLGAIQGLLTQPPEPEVDPQFEQRMRQLGVIP